MSASSEDLKAVYGDHLVSRFAASAATFRRIAADLDRLAADVVDINPAVRAGSATSLAQRAIHEAMWGVANAKLDAIVSAAADYDRHVSASGTDTPEVTG